MTSAAAPAIVHSAREQWLAERQKGVGASELAAILGVDPRRGPLSVYAEKVAGRLSEEEESWLAFGRDVEGAIAKGYEHKTGRIVRDLGAYEIVRHPSLPILGATLDRRQDGSARYPTPAGASGEGALELKAVGFHKAHEWAEDPPLFFVVQLQAQMGCAVLEWGSLGALFGGISIADPVDLVPNAPFMDAALAAVERFWWHVDNRVPPGADAKPETREAIRRLWPKDDGETVPLDTTALDLVAKWENLKLARDTAKDAAEGLENQLRALIGAASFASLPDGSLLSLTMTERAGYTVAPTSYRTLRHKTPRIPRRR